MTKFILTESKIRVNDVQLNKFNVLNALKELFSQFPYPKEFTIKEIKILKEDKFYSEKSLRAMISIFEKLGYIEKLQTKEKKPIKYRFKLNNLEKIIAHFNKMG